jgi:YD repeat-containing protein
MDVSKNSTLRFMSALYAIGVHASRSSPSGQPSWNRSDSSADPDGLQSLEYTYDLAGNILTQTDTRDGVPQTQTYTYDLLDRLTGASVGDGTLVKYSPEAYEYDDPMDMGRLMSKAGVT